jgi:hypothetical protein
VGFAVRLFKGIIKGREGGEYVYRKLMEIFELFL